MESNSHVNLEENAQTQTSSTSDSIKQHFTFARQTTQNSNKIGLRGATNNDTGKSQERKVKFEGKTGRIFSWRQAVERCFR